MKSALCERMDMDQKLLRDIVLRILLSELAKQDDFRVPVNASNRHIHLSRKDIDDLFSPGYELTKLRDLVQPGQYACKEQVMMQTDAGQLLLRVVGPIRDDTQIEISVSEAISLKLEPMLRLSGNIEGTPGCFLINGSKRTRLEKGVIVAARHMHMSLLEAQAYGLENGDVVSLHVKGPREAIFPQVIVRSGMGHVLEAHIDREEANACGLADGQLCQIIKSKEVAPSSIVTPAIKLSSTIVREPNGRGLLSEEDVRSVISKGQTSIRFDKNTIITPLAWDTARENNVELIRE